MAAGHKMFGPLLERSKEYTEGNPQTETDEFLDELDKIYEKFKESVPDFSLVRQEREAEQQVLKIMSTHEGAKVSKVEWTPSGVHAYNHYP